VIIGRFAKQGNIMSIFETLMLIAFGSAWPLSIYKSFIARTNKGKSLFFLIIVFIGYISGIIHKILNSKDYVIFFYCLNCIMVLIDIIMYIRNFFIEKRNQNIS